MEMYARYYRDFDFPISTLFWGALIFVALIAFWILAGAALRWLRNRGDSTANRWWREDTPSKDAFTETLEEIWHSDHQTGMASTTPHETDKFPLIDKTRKQRKAIKEHRKACEKAQKHRYN